MKNNIFFPLIMMYLFTSCTSNERKTMDKAVDGDVMIMGKDTFDVCVDTHTVISSAQMPPGNVMEESSPVWINKTDLDSSFKTRSHIPVGTKQVYKFFKKRK